MPGLGGMPGSSSQVPAPGAPRQTSGGIAPVHAVLTSPHPSPQPTFHGQVPAPSAPSVPSGLTPSAPSPLAHAAHASLAHESHAPPPPAGRPIPHASLAGPRAPFPPAPTTDRGVPLASQPHTSLAHATHALPPPTGRRPGDCWHARHCPWLEAPLAKRGAPRALGGPHPNKRRSVRPVVLDGPPYPQPAVPVAALPRPLAAAASGASRLPAFPQLHFLGKAFLCIGRRELPRYRSVSDAAPEAVFLQRTTPLPPLSLLL